MDADPGPFNCAPPSALRLDSAAMLKLIGRALAPAAIGVSCARHVAWYVSYQMSGEAR